MITGKHIAETAVNSGLIGKPYSQYDCQALVEKVLELSGLHIINYRGSNHMWRDLVYDRGSLKTYFPPLGSLAFIVRNDGGEVKRGYHDDMGNATHVAIVLDDETVFESTTGGVQYGKLSRFTDYGLIKDVSYDEGGGDNAGEGCSFDVNRLLELVRVLRDNVDGLEVYIRENIRNS